MRCNLLIFFFFLLSWIVVLMPSLKTLPSLRSQTLFFLTLKVLCITFKSAIHFELIFAWCVRLRSRLISSFFPFFFSLFPSFSFFYDAQLLQHHLLKGYPIFIELLSHIYKKSARYIYVDLFLGVNSILTQHLLHMERWNEEFTASLCMKEEGFCEVISVREPNAKSVGKHRTWSTKEIICLAMAETSSLSFKKKKKNRSCLRHTPAGYGQFSASPLSSTCIT